MLLFDCHLISLSCKSIGKKLASDHNARNQAVAPGSLSKELKVYRHLKQYTFENLKLATWGFRFRLGVGILGSVYKGWVSRTGTSPSRPTTGLPVAVKILNKNGSQGHHEFTEVINRLGGGLDHPHLVKLIGYCTEGALVYEFISKGSLDKHLFKRLYFPLQWSVRMKIMLGAAKGLAYLHEDAEKPLIYRNFKTSSILLDRDYNARLSDSVLVWDGPVGDSTDVSTRVWRTQGYAAPEYIMTGHPTAKSDVYSFGVVLLEMLTGRRSIDKRRRRDEVNLVEWARPKLRLRGEGFRELMDPQLKGLYSGRGARRAMELAYRCISREAIDRPSMSEVVEVLSSLPRYHEKIASSSPPSLPSPLFEGLIVGSSNHDGFIVGTSGKGPSHFRAPSCNLPLPSTKASGGMP
ncbi:serine/threonine-protein kinase PBL35-like [Lotus japonicus]|uniref:serine/threonine-protein kinase PBL35-like n=1 Tax=Lotus japonicus TaxID=34305 RepID=UPI0025863E47|nr:serine/threonine-protein kinase PBL35-like [Lotus japonicus]